MGRDAFSMHRVAIRRRRWPWVLALATIVISAVTNGLIPSDDFSPLELIDVAILFAFVLVGALLSARVRGNVVGPLLLTAGVTVATTITLSSLAVFAVDLGDVPVTLVAIAGLVSGIGILVPFLLVLIGIPLVFPDGHLLSPRWRWVVLLSVAVLASAAVSQIFGPDPIGRSGLPNPFYVPALSGLTEVLGTAVPLLAILALGTAALAMIVRYRRGDEVERQQLKWLIAGPCVAGISFSIAFMVPSPVVSDVAFYIALIALLAMPLAIGAAILRYRLYEIDRIIGRTIGWALISGLLVGSFAGLVVGLQAVLVDVTQGQTLAVAASTLVAFALFQPVRRTVQAAVDRRFDRARYDAYRTADSFADRLRNEVDLDTLAAELEGTVSTAVRPTSASLWLAVRASNR
jgi:hypothetical protein